MAMKTEHILVIVVVGALLISTGALDQLRAGVQSGRGFDFSWLWGGGGGSKLVDVNKKLDIALNDLYTGSSLNSKTVYLYINGGKTKRETLTTDASDGTATTSYTYPSGTSIWFNYISSNDKKWWQITVPQMNEKDAESSTYNVVPLEAFSIGTYSSDSLTYSNGTAMSDEGTHTVADSGATPTFKYTLANTGADNTGLMSSYDAEYSTSWDHVVYLVISGTGYESVLVYGDFDYDFTLGNTHYLAKRMDPYKLTVHKEAWKYLSTGTDDMSFWLDLSGIDTGDSVTFQMYFYGYTDPSWCRDHGGDFGHAKVELAEHTFTITP